MHVDPQRLVNALLRCQLTSFVARSFAFLNPGTAFARNWHLEAIAYQLDRVERGEIRRLIINLPPRSLKSLIVSVAWPAYLLGRNPRRRIIAISYGDDLALKHAAECRALLHSAWYQAAFPQAQIRRSTAGEMVTTARGCRKATSVLGALTGFGGDLIIIDDPLKPADALSATKRNAVNHWFANTLLSRLDHKESGAIVIVMQRVHLDDLTGFVTSLSDDWEVLSLPAIAEEDAEINLNDQFAYRRPVGDALHPERESLATLQELQRMMGPEVFAAQYQQRPVPTGGALITRDGLSYYDTPPPRHRQGRVLQSWDVAAKDGVENDFSVCTTWLRQDGHFYLLDLTRERFTFPRLRETALRLAEQFKPDEILIEDASVGVALAQELRHKGEAIVTLQPVHRDKLARLYVQQEKFAAKRVHFPRGAPFLRDLEDELLTFPQGRHDDQVDSLSQALAYEGPSYDSSLAWVGSPDDKLPYMAGMAMARASWRR